MLFEKQLLQVSLLSTRLVHTRMICVGLHVICLRRESGNKVYTVHQPAGACIQQYDCKQDSTTNPPLPDRGDCSVKGFVLRCPIRYNRLHAIYILKQQS